MHFDIFTLLPEMFQGPLDSSIIGRARRQGIISVQIHNIRDATTDKHHVCDDTPYGGGAGMVMKVDPIFNAVESVYEGGPIIYLSPQGRQFTQQVALELSEHTRLTLLCGHYEGVDERVIEHLVTDSISIGDFVLTGGELAAMVIVDAVARLLPGTLGDIVSTHDESHMHGLLEYPHYTRPLVFRDWPVPDVLLSGNHALINRWRRKQTMLRTCRHRPDLFEHWLAVNNPLTKMDQQILDEIVSEEIHPS